MDVNRKDVLEILNSVRPGLAASEVIEQSTSFVFMGGMVYTYNDEIAVSREIGFDFDGAVQAKELFDLLNKMKDETVQIFIYKGELIVQGAKIKAGIRINTEIQLPPLDIADDEDWYDLPNDFSEAVRICIFSAAPESVSAVLNSIHVKDNFIESCDNFRLTRYYFEEDIGREILIPSYSARIVSNYVFSSFCVSDGWIHFHSEAAGIQLSCRTYDEAYPDLEEILDVEGDDVELPKELSEMIDRSGIFSVKDDTSLIDIEIGNNQCVVKSENDKGWIHEKTPIKAKGVEFGFSMSPSILKDILKLTSTAILGDKSLKFTTDEFEHIVTLSVK